MRVSSDTRWRDQWAMTVILLYVEFMWRLQHGLHLVLRV